MLAQEIEMAQGYLIRKRIERTQNIFFVGLEQLKGREGYPVTNFSLLATQITELFIEELVKECLEVLPYLGEAQFSIGMSFMRESLVSGHHLKRSANILIRIALNL